MGKNLSRMRYRVVYRFGSIAMTCGRPTVITDANGHVVEFIPHPELDVYRFEIVAERNGASSSTTVVLGADAGRALVAAIAQVGADVGASPGLIREPAETRANLHAWCDVQKRGSDE